MVPSFVPVAILGPFLAAVYLSHYRSKTKPTQANIDKFIYYFAKSAT